MPATNNQRPATSLILRDRRAIVLWLTICALLLALMVAIGGYTRLSGSGLSITQWKPVHGALPPLSLEQWQEEFAAYQQSPQYLKVNRGMTLDDFKTIFWPEFTHRLLGRLIGVVFFLPLLIFANRRSISARLGWRLAGIFALGGLQGLIGWMMVASGLVDDPQVNFIRLALHLSVALAIFGLILWAMLDVLSSQFPVLSKSPFSPATGNRQLATYLFWFVLLCLQIILGACMAGLHAGLAFNSWPDMNGQFIPDNLLSDRIALVQFAHRNLAVLVVVSFLFWWYCQREYVKNTHLGKVCAGVTSIIAIQFTLGVLTLLHMVPLSLALAHQLTALALFAASVTLLHGLMTK